MKTRKTAVNKVKTLAAKTIPAKKAGKVKGGLGEIHLSKRVDQASADLFLKCVK